MSLQPYGPKARGIGPGFADSSLYLDLSGNSSQFSIGQPITLEEIKDSRAANPLRGVVGCLKLMRDSMGRAKITDTEQANSAASNFAVIQGEL